MALAPTRERALEKRLNRSFPKVRIGGTLEKRGSPGGFQAMANGGEGLTIRTLGPMQIDRNGEAITVPASRKARAILGFLILSPRPVGRQRLCEMFFDVPDDPRASLRWTLTKLRAAIDEPGVSRIVSSGDSLKFEAAGARVDALDILKGEAGATESNGVFLEDSELPDRQDFMSWLYSAREDLRN